MNTLSGNTVLLFGEMKDVAPHPVIMLGIGPDGHAIAIRTDRYGNVLMNTREAGQIEISLTVDTAAYAVGDNIGGKITIAEAMNVVGQRGFLETLGITDLANQRPELRVYIFSSDPVAATITDQAPFVLSTDFAKVVASFDVKAADYVVDGGVASAYLPVNLPVNAVGSRNLYAALVVNSGAPDFVTAADLSLRFNLIQDATP